MSGKGEANSSAAVISALIVDDDPIVRKFHKMVLKKLKIDAQMAENGKEAVDLCHSGVSFDLVLMDMEMPVMDGPEATKELRAMGVKSMIVGVTSRGLDHEKQAFMEAGLNHCLVKPLTADKIGSLLQDLKNSN